MIACFLPTLSRSRSKMWTHSLIIQKYKVTYHDLCSTSKLLHQWNGFVDNNKGSKSTSAVCKAILWQCLSLKVLDRSSSTEKQSPYHHEIMSLNSDDAIDIISWEPKKSKKRSVLSGGGWTAYFLSSVNYNDLSQSPGACKLHVCGRG